MNLAGYLARIGVTPPLTTTAETLRRIHVAHLAAFPFHNLAIQRGDAVRVDVDAVAEKFLARDGGGYCFEQNTLLAAALRELGFEVTTLLGRVGGHSLNHMLLRVDVDGQAWLADAGFGGEGPLEPIPLQEAIRVTQDGIDYSLSREGQEWTLVMHYGEVTEEMYRFSELPFTAGDVEMANYYTSTWPNSIFRHTLTIQRVTADERLILRPKVITRYRNGVRTDRPIEPAQIRHFARELFGVELGEGRMLFEDD
jgi:N-hydroxyarylamine O-acetyltransferase